MISKDRRVYLERLKLAGFRSYELLALEYPAEEIWEVYVNGNN